MTAKKGLRRAGIRGRRPARPSGDDREAAILETFERLLAERSFSAVSVDDLARGAGISRPSFYFYFASKDAVLVRLLDRVISQAAATSAAAFTTTPAEDRQGCWREAITAYYETFRAHRAVALAVAEAAAASPEVRALWAGGVDGWVRACTATIEAERRRGAAPPGRPARDLAIALNAMNERTLHATFSGEQPAIAEQDVVDVLLEIWLGAIYGSVPSTVGPGPVSTVG